MGCVTPTNRFSTHSGLVNQNEQSTTGHTLMPYVNGAIWAFDCKRYPHRRSVRSRFTLSRRLGTTLLPLVHLSAHCRSPLGPHQPAFSRRHCNAAWRDFATGHLLKPSTHPPLPVLGKRAKPGRGRAFFHLRQMLFRFSHNFCAHASGGGGVLRRGLTLHPAVWRPLVTIVLFFDCTKPGSCRAPRSPRTKRSAPDRP